VEVFQPSYAGFFHTVSCCKGLSLSCPELIF
jgi:hypothetical protein